MKKNLSLALSLILLLFAACKKNAPVASGELASTSGELKITSVIAELKNLPTAQLRRLAYSTLSPKEKYAAWKDNAVQLSTSFTAEQKVVAAELTNFISPDLFVSFSPLKTMLFIDQWLIKAKKVFTDAQIRSLAFDLYAKPDVVAVNEAELRVNTEDGGGTECNCSEASNFCGDKKKCDANSNCREPSSHCGAFWQYKCDNVCAASNPE
ncbi:bacteriocin fulvocin C-related protein [Mucilaginibacter myungsuensis]|uniref:Bacteriocin fulvocin C-related protein n=1 Tax=Mucilaginibacter myungsuensis TaxID=649104 RepID=A0A929KZN0_9SPHI|nr:bacteriocin fulvocin C-related protein [Mucilaginibacter myungsuensis]MBE9662903.1 bacteriocin fulvocin C-related protein [Mucilaginibacter myungsuensis]MDN3598523.1 bacteriocin fulvocin C-related protein [Mucilaginibacter myungsuensis]